MASRTIFLVLVAILAPFVYDRYVAFSSLVANRPGKLQKVYNIKSHEVKFPTRMRNCEDIIIDEAMGIAFLSCDPGRDRWNTVMGTFLAPLGGQVNMDDGGIWIYDYSTPGLPDSEALKPLVLINFESDLHPLGLEFDFTTSTLYVVNHSRNCSAIDVFQVSVQQATAKHVAHLQHPLISAPNAIHSLGDGRLLITNDHYIRAAKSRVLSKIETFSGVPGGSVVYTEVRNPDITKTLAHVPFANGITMLNATTAAVASTTKSGIYFYTWNSVDYTFTYQTRVRLPVNVDNLSTDSKGKLLMSGHPYVPTLMKVAEGRATCSRDGFDKNKQPCDCSSPSWAAEWSEKYGLKEIYKDDGAEFCSSSTYVRDASRGVGILSGLYERGILVMTE